jgi:3-hydroxybutyryl-CoA dehydrogenase
MSSDLQTIGICGLGQMGAAASVCFARAGYKVLLWGRDLKKLAATSARIDRLRTWMEEHVGASARQDGSVELVPELSALADRCDLVMDAIAEVMQQKVELFEQLHEATRRGAIFITTTSGLSITEMGRLARCGAQLAGTHFWNPPHLMPLVEVVRGAETRDDVIDRVCEVVRAIGKVPVRVERDVPGFIGNRLLHALWREAIELVQRGIASPADIDTVARLTFGLRAPVVGPLENMDLVGLDLVKTIHEYLLSDLSDAHRPQEALATLVDNGNTGIKSGGGFYDWSKRDPKQLIERRDRQIVRQLEYLRELNAT